MFDSIESTSINITCYTRNVQAKERRTNLNAFIGHQLSQITKQPVQFRHLLPNLSKTLTSLSKQRTRTQKVPLQLRVLVPPDADENLIIIGTKNLQQQPQLHPLALMSVKI
jgi:hypothetical protein